MSGIFPDFSANTVSTNYNLYQETVDPSGNVSRIIDEEISRINAKEVSVNKEYETKERKEHFIRSSVSRKKAYYRMLMIVFIMVGVSGLLVYAKRFFPFIPDVVIDLLVIAIVSVGIIYLINAYMDISKRDRMDFDKIDFSYLYEPNEIDKSNEPVTEISEHKNTADDKLCIGGNCCPAGTIINGVCTLETFTGKIEPFSPMPQYVPKM
jgi:hypothetical protein